MISRLKKIAEFIQIEDLRNKKLQCIKKIKKTKNILIWPSFNFFQIGK